MKILRVTTSIPPIVATAAPSISYKNDQQDLVVDDSFYKHSKHFLLFSSIISGAFALFPATRLEGLATYRSITFCVTTLNSVKGWKQDDYFLRSIKISKIFLTLYRIAAFALHSRKLVIAGLASDIGLNILECGKAIYDGKIAKIFKPIAVIAASSLVIAGMVTGLSELMLVAGVISSISFALFGILNVSSEDYSRIFERGSYFILGGISLAIAIIIRPYESHRLA